MVMREYRIKYIGGNFSLWFKTIGTLTSIKNKITQPRVEVIQYRSIRKGSKIYTIKHRIN